MIGLNYDWDRLSYLGFSEETVNKLKALDNKPKANPLDSMAVAPALEPVPARKQPNNFGELSESSLQFARDVYAESVDKDSMPCNKPHRTPDHPTKKSIVKACENGKEKIVRFGDQHMRIRKTEPARRKSFRARHKCDQDNSKLSARYWSCKAW